MKHLEPILAGSKSQHVWDLGGKSLARMYHLKPAVSEISGEKTDNPTDNLDNHLLKIRARKGRRHISSILTSPKPVLSMPANIRWQRACIFASSAFCNTHKQAHCILPIKTDSLDPTLWMWPKATDQSDAQTISLPWTSLLLFHAFSLTKRRFHPPSYQQSPLLRTYNSLYLNILRFHDGARYNKTV